MSHSTEQEYNALLITKNLAFKVRFYKNYSNLVDQFTQHQHKLMLIAQHDINKALAVLQPIITNGVIALKEHDADLAEDLDVAVSSLNESEQIVTKLITEMRGGVS